MFKTWMLLALLAAAVPAFAHDITGAWDFTVETDAGSGNPSFEFKQVGEKLTGTYSGMFGKAALTGTVKGDRIEFSFEVSGQGVSGKMTYRGTIESATKMKGEVQLAEAGKGTWTGTKK
jgi:hypothetical protein